MYGEPWHTHTSSFPAGVGSTASLINNPSIAQDRRRAELHGAMSFVSLRHREVELLPKGNFWSHFLAVSCHRALLKGRYLDSTTSNLENWVLFFPEKGGGCTENERQKWRVDQWRINSHTWSGAVGWSHTGVDGARHRCAQWGGDRLVCHQSNTQCTQRVVKKVGQSTNFGSLYLGHFLPDLDNSPLIRFLLSCRKRNKNGNSVFRTLKKSPEVSSFRSCFETVGFHCTCCPWPMCAVRWHASCVRQGFFSISSCPQRRRWLMVLLSFSFVACHNPSLVILSTIYRQEDAAAFPAFLCGLRVGMMLTRRSCMGIRGRLRLAPALAQGNLHGKDVHLFALRPHLSTKIAFICTRGGRFS